MLVIVLRLHYAFCSHCMLLLDPYGLSSHSACKLADNTSRCSCFLCQTVLCFSDRYPQICTVVNESIVFHSPYLGKLLGSHRFRSLVISRVIKTPLTIHDRMQLSFSGNDRVIKRVVTCEISSTRLCYSASRNIHI